VNRGRIPFTASNTDASTIAACRVPGGPGTAAIVCASISVVFQSVTASADAALGAASAPSTATASSTVLVVVDKVCLLWPRAGDSALGDGATRPSRNAQATLMRAGGSLQHSHDPS